MAKPLLHGLVRLLRFYFTKRHRLATGKAKTTKHVNTQLNARDRAGGKGHVSITMESLERNANRNEPVAE